MLLVEIWAARFVLPKNVTMKGSNYIHVLKAHMLAFWRIHQCNHFMHDGAPAHKSKSVSKFLIEHNLKVFEWPDNSPDLNPIFQTQRIVMLQIDRMMLLSKIIRETLKVCLNMKKIVAQMVGAFSQPGPWVILFTGVKDDRPKPNLPKWKGIQPFRCSVWVC